MRETLEPIVVEQDLAASPSAVWAAITEPERMRAWFFAPIEDFRAEPGFESRFVVHVDGRDFEHVWNVRDVVPGERLTYGWRYEGYPGDSTVRWELAGTPTGTRLTFTHEYHEAFPQDDPIFSREAGVQGWDYFVRGTLKAYVEEGRRANAPA